MDLDHAEYLDKFGSEFNRTYIAAALADIKDSAEWESEESPSPNDLSDLTITNMLNQCQAFHFAAHEYYAGRESEAGTDFWLTRNGHGAGFWDGDWPEPAATILTVAAGACGPVELTVGDDGKIHD